MFDSSNAGLGGVAGMFKTAEHGTSLATPGSVRIHTPVASENT